jgi:hypothetical protein
MGMQIRKLIIFLFSSLNQTRESKVKPTPLLHPALPIHTKAFRAAFPKILERKKTYS